MGTKFTVYDGGMNPGKTTSSLEASNLRQELAAICYVSQPPEHTGHSSEHKEHWGEETRYA